MKLKNDIDTIYIKLIDGECMWFTTIDNNRWTEDKKSTYTINKESLDELYNFLTNDCKSSITLTGRYISNIFHEVMSIFMLYKHSIGYVECLSIEKNIKEMRQKSGI